jgi:hypothetical protein
VQEKKLGRMVEAPVSYLSNFDSYSKAMMNCSRSTQIGALIQTFGKFGDGVPGPETAAASHQSQVAKGDLEYLRLNAWYLSQEFCCRHIGSAVLACRSVIHSSQKQVGSEGFSWTKSEHVCIPNGFRVGEKAVNRTAGMPLHHPSAMSTWS